MCRLSHQTLSRTSTPAARPRETRLRVRPPSRVVVLRREFQEEVALDGIAAAGFEAGDRRIPRRRPCARRDRAEPQIVGSRGEVKSGPELVAPLDERGRRRETVIDRWKPPLREDRFGPHQVIPARIFDVASPGSLRERAVLVAPDCRSCRVAGHEGTMRRRGADNRPGQGMHGGPSGHLAPAVVVMEFGVRERPDCHRSRQFDDVVGGVRLDARVPSERVGERHARSAAADIGDRIGGEPSATAHLHQFVRVGRDRVRPQDVRY